MDSSLWLKLIISYYQQLDVPHSVSKRQGHSLSVFIMSPQYVWIMTVGGAVDGGDTVEYPNVVMSTELGKYKWVNGSLTIKVCIVIMYHKVLSFWCWMPFNDTNNYYYIVWVYVCT